jgi:predicted NACHT family NTPase
MPIDPLTAAITATVTWIVDKYGEMFVDKMAEGVAGKREDRAVRKQWQQATTTYLQKLHDEVNNLRVLGKLESQPLEQIYTDVNVLSKLSAERRYRLDELEAEFMPRRRWLREESERRDGLTVATETQRLFILGKPGAGKTTFLKHVALRTIKENAREDGDKKLPIFVTLKEQSDSGQELVPFIAAQFARADFPEAETFVRRLLKAGDAVVLLDGLDEVNLEGRRRARLITAIKQFVHEFDRCRILLTCRVAATDYSFERFAYVEMADFDRAQQQRFIYRWFQEDMAKRDNCWQALQASRNDTLQELAQNPLLLSLLCVTFEERNEFPAERSEIYREATQALLGKWDARRNIQRDPIYQSLSLRWREGLLAYIAAQTFGNKVYFIPQRTLVRLIEKYLQGVPGIAEPDGAYVLQSMEAQHGLLVGYHCI